MTIQKYMTHGIDILVSRGWSVPHATQAINHCMQHVLDCSWSEVFMRHEEIFDASLQARFLRILQRLVDEHKPLAYELGTMPFLDCDITLRPPVLIPRQETENWCSEIIALIQLQESTLEFSVEKQIMQDPLASMCSDIGEKDNIFDAQLQQQNSAIDKDNNKNSTGKRSSAMHSDSKNLVIIDMCTGSGCIGIAIAKAMPSAQVYAADISSHACGLALGNAAHNKVSNISVIRSDLFCELMHLRGSVDYIVSNPPYVSYGEWLTVEPSVREWEDYHALVAPDEGFLYIQAIVESARLFLRKRECVMPRVWIEIGADQGERALLIARMAGFEQSSILQDLAGRARVLQLIC